MSFQPRPPASPTQSATGGVSPGWQIGYSAFGLFGLIVLGAFGTLFAICLLRAKQRYSIGEYTPSTFDEWERAHRLTRPPPRRKWWRVIGENFCCCLRIWSSTQSLCHPQSGDEPSIQIYFYLVVVYVHD
ncbi:hypothetical protein BDV41DRAFT_414748 [Aspergillus transmontanensis]|uniref:Uncharacterized protein n=1 Tax=Aspergillus transmontanensis TaxID=1034304 RepID=A0A5N6WBR3_9EURO|nr:hypothetical protein BDV41DRAFT_414748 [Aspergillus transmontanensis]